MKKNIVSKILKPVAISLIVAAFNLPFNGFASGADKSPSEDYSVHILISTQRLMPDDKKFKGISDIHEEVGNGLYKYKYTTGRIQTLNEASALRKKMIEEGFKGAFIVHYRDGKRMDLKNTSGSDPVASLEKSAAPNKPLMTEEKPKASEKNADSAKSKSGAGFSVTQVNPQFPGGEDSLSVYIRSHLHYGVEKKDVGQVFVGFLVDHTGKIKDIKIITGATEERDAEALRLIREMPNWKPAMIGNTAIDKDCGLLIDFQPPQFK